MYIHVLNLIQAIWSDDHSRDFSTSLRFLKACKGCRIDAVAVHSYWCSLSGVSWKFFRETGWHPKITYAIHGCAWLWVSSKNAWLWWLWCIGWIYFTLPPPPMRARGKERFKTTNLLFLMLKFPMDSGRHFFWSTKIPRSRFWIKQNPSQKVAWSCSVWGLTVRLTSEATITFWNFCVQIHPKKSHWLNLSNFVLRKKHVP